MEIDIMENNLLKCSPTRLVDRDDCRIEVGITAVLEAGGFRRQVRAHKAHVQWTAIHRLL